MSRFRHAVKDRDQHIRTLRAACGVLIFFCCLPAPAGCRHLAG